MGTGDVKEDSDRQQCDDEGRTPVRDERERDSRQRGETENGREVDQRLSGDERDKSRRKPLAERILTGERDAQTRIGKGREGGDHPRNSDEAELLADHGHDHVSVRFGQVVHLPHALAEADAEDAARAEADHRLHGLETGAERVVPGIEKAEETRAAVGREDDRGESEPGDDPGSEGKRPPGRAGDEEDHRDHDHDRDRGAEVGFGEDERAKAAEKHPDGAPEVLHGLRCPPAREIRRDPDRERDLGELGGLKCGRPESDPASRAVYPRPDREHGEAQEESADQE